MAEPAEMRPAAASGGKVLVVDDQRNMRATTAMLLRQAGHAVEEAESGGAAIRRVQQQPFDVVLTDLRMPDVDGLEVLRAVRAHAPDTQVIVMTGYGTIESAVEAMRQGALDYVSKPFKADELLLRIARAVEQRRLRGHMHLLADDFRRRYGLEHIVGTSPAIREVLERVQRVAPTDAAHTDCDDANECTIDTCEAAAPSKRPVASVYRAGGTVVCLFGSTVIGSSLSP